MSRRWPEATDASPAPRRRTARALALVAAGAAVAALAPGVVSALWAHAVPVSGATLRSGSITLTVNGSAATTVPASIAPALTTSASTFVPLVVRNGGSVPVSYRLDRLDASSATPALLTTGLSLRIGVPTSAGACTAGTPGPLIALTTGTSVSGAAYVTRRPLAAGAAELVCVQLTAPSVVSGSLQPGSAQLVLRFHAQSV